MDLNLTEVIKENIKKGPSYKNNEVLFEMCDKLGIKTIEQFWDVLIQSQRLYCDRNFWNHEFSPCLDEDGDHIAYGKEEIATALEKPSKDLTCHDICEVCGSCAYINSIDARLFYYLAEQMDDRGLTINEEISNS